MTNRRNAAFMMEFVHAVASTLVKEVVVRTTVRGSFHPWEHSYYTDRNLRYKKITSVPDATALKMVDLHRLALTCQGVDFFAVGEL
jgi:hypothetical protein